MKLFISYARHNRPAVDSLVRRIQQLGHETWVDSKLEGGQAWWDEILEEIRACDAFVFALSDASVESEACNAERRYATALSKTVVPVAVAPVRTQLLPPDVAGIQIVDYSKPGEDSAIELARALTGLTPSPPLAQPLPEPPPVPTSYLSDLGTRVARSTLTRDEQLALAEDIRVGLQRARNRNNEEDYEAGLDLLRRLQERPDLYAATADRIQAVMAAAVRPEAPPAPEPEREPEPEPAPQHAVHPPVHPPMRPPAAGAPQPQPQRQKRSRGVTVLAVIGGIFILLIAIGACNAACYDEFGNYVC